MGAIDDHSVLAAYRAQGMPHDFPHKIAQETIFRLMFSGRGRTLNLKAPLANRPACIRKLCAH